MQIIRVAYRGFGKEHSIRIEFRQERMTRIASFISGDARKAFAWMRDFKGVEL